MKFSKRVLGSVSVLGSQTNFPSNLFASSVNCRATKPVEMANTRGKSLSLKGEETGLGRPKRRADGGDDVYVRSRAIREAIAGLPRLRFYQLILKIVPEPIRLAPKHLVKREVNAIPGHLDPLSQDRPAPGDNYRRCFRNCGQRTRNFPRAPRSPPAAGYTFCMEPRDMLFMTLSFVVNEERHRHAAERARMRPACPLCPGLVQNTCPA